MKEFARRGAEARIAELNHELEAIYGAFPDLRQARGRNGAGTFGARRQEPPAAARSTRRGRAAAGREEGEAEMSTRGRARRKMTAAERKAVGERMRKYWASRRAEAGAKKR